MTKEELKARLQGERYRKPTFIEKNFPKVFTFLGIGLVVSAILIALINYNFIRNSIETQGEVIRLDGGKYRQGYAPVVQYFDEKQLSYLYYSTEFSRPPRYHIGQKVIIYYNKNDHADANMGYSWLAILILSGIGTLFVFFGFLFQKAFFS